MVSVPYYRERGIALKCLILAWSTCTVIKQPLALILGTDVALMWHSYEPIIFTAFAQ
jgi:hypothetical protein